MTEHRLKISSDFYHGFQTGLRSFYVTENNGRYRIGDVITLLEWDFENNIQKTHGDYHIDAMVPNECSFIIVYILTDRDSNGIKEGFCILELAIIRESKEC